MSLLKALKHEEKPVSRNGSGKKEKVQSRSRSNTSSSINRNDDSTISRTSSLKKPKTSSNSLARATTKHKTDYNTHRHLLKQEEEDQTVEPVEVPNQADQTAESIADTTSASAPPESTKTEDEAPPRPVKSESNGFLSSILTAAHNAISSDHHGQSKEHLDTHSSNNTSGDAKKDHSFSNKLDFLLKPAKFGSTTKSFSSEDDERSNSAEVNENGHETSPEQQNGAPQHPSANVQFESVRESPLNSIGRGDLSLDAFDSYRKVKSLDAASLTTPGAGASSPLHSNGKRSDSISRRLMITPNHSTDNIHDLKNMSPDRLNRSLPSAQQLVVSGGAENKRVHRKSIGTGSINEEHRISSDSKVRSSAVPSDIESDSDSEESDGEDLDEIIDFSQLKFASKKKNKEFHATFKKLPSGEKLYHDCSCALSKDILVQGRMYISEHYICFNSNILGWVTNIVIPLEEVILIEKKSTAVLFPNGMVIRTLHHKYVFATFLTRDATFDLITNIWHRVLLESADVDPSKLYHTQSGGKRRGRNGSKSTDQSKSASRSYGSDSSDEESSGSEELHLDEVDEEDGDRVSGEENEKQKDDDDSEEDNGDDAGASNIEKKINKHRDSKNGDSPSGKGTGSEEGGEGFKGFPVVGPLTHDPTETDYKKQASDTFITEETFKAPLGAVFLILFGSDSSKFIQILKKQKNFDITESDITGLGADSKERNYTYIKPLGGPIGPKQTKCLIADKLVEFSPDNFILVEQTTQTPDVPSGNSFKVRTKIYLSWAAGNSTKIFVVTTVEWSGKSWIKGAIEKGSIDGQKESMKVLVDQVNEMISSGNGSGSKSKAKPKKKSRSRKNTVSQSKSESKEDSKPEPVPEGIQQQFVKLVESIGKAVPIPYLGDFITGSILLLLGFVLLVKTTNLIIGTGPSKAPAIEYFTDDSYGSSKIRINDQKYLIIPTSGNKKMRMESEVNLWNWVRERSDNKLNIEHDGVSHADDPLNQKYSDQEIREIVRLTQLKLDKLSERFEILRE